VLNVQVKVSEYSQCLIIDYLLYVCTNCIQIRCSQAPDILDY